MKSSPVLIVLESSIAMNSMMRPGSPLAARPLHFFWIVDCSGSMQGDKIQSLNYAINGAIPAMIEAARSNPNAQIQVRAVKFSTGAQWHVAQATPVEQFRWPDVAAGGETHMGAALRLVAEQLRGLSQESRLLPPVLVLLSDGQPTDDFDDGLRALLDTPIGRKSVRIAIAIGRDADSDPLQRFIGHSEQRPLQANNAESLVHYIRWASTVVTSSVSRPTTGGSAFDAKQMENLRVTTSGGSGPEVW